VEWSSDLQEGDLSQQSSAAVLQTSRIEKAWVDLRPVLQSAGLPEIVQRLRSSPSQVHPDSSPEDRTGMFR